jgi:phospholipid/cholesterol/gamma-HCH transport system substrate-binding protein
MVSRARGLGAGAFLVGLVALVVVVAVWVSGEHVVGKTFWVVSKDDITGLLPHSRVLYRGLRAGEVEGIQLDPADHRQILIRIHVRASIPVTQGTYARLHLEGITGLKQVVLDDKFTDPRPLTGDDSRVRIPLHPGFLDRIADEGEVLLKNLNTVVGQVARLLDERTLGSVRRILVQLEEATRGLVHLEKNADRQLTELPATAKDALRSLHAAADELRKQMAALGTAGQEATRTLNRRSLPELNSALEQLRRTAADVQRLSESLRQNPQQLLGGPGALPPGPGEPGYRRPRP